MLFWQLTVKLDILYRSCKSNAERSNGCRGRHSGSSYKMWMLHWYEAIVFVFLYFHFEQKLAEGIVLNIRIPGSLFYVQQIYEELFSRDWAVSLISSCACLTGGGDEFIKPKRVFLCVSVCACRCVCVCILREVSGDLQGTSVGVSIYSVTAHWAALYKHGREGRRGVERTREVCVRGRGNI